MVGRLAFFIIITLFSTLGAVYYYSVQGLMIVGWVCFAIFMIFELIMIFRGMDDGIVALIIRAIIYLGLPLLFGMLVGFLAIKWTFPQCLLLTSAGGIIVPIIGTLFYD